MSIDDREEIETHFSITLCSHYFQYRLRYIQIKTNQTINLILILINAFTKHYKLAND